VAAEPIAEQNGRARVPKRHAESVPRERARRPRKRGGANGANTRLKEQTMTGPQKVLRLPMVKVKEEKEMTEPI
jgi:hypothetical protein